MRVAFGIYFGWVTAASIVSVSQALFKWGFKNGSENMVWTEVGWLVCFNN